VKLFSCVSFITLQILGFFHQLVLILIFYGVTVKTKNRETGKCTWCCGKLSWLPNVLLHVIWESTFAHLLRFGVGYANCLLVNKKITQLLRK